MNYELKELAEFDTDAWVNALSFLDDEYLDEALKIADDDDIIRWAKNCRCPAELEVAFTKVAKEYECVFNENGKLVSRKVA